MSAEAGPSRNLAAQAPARASKNRRVRKRRKRAQSYDTGSSSDDSSSSDDEEQQQPPKKAAAVTADAMDVDRESSSDDSSSSSSSSDSSDSESGSDDDDSSSSDSSDDNDEGGRRGGTKTSAKAGVSALDEPTRRKREQRFPSLSPSPPPMAIPSFLAPASSKAQAPAGANGATTAEVRGDGAGTAEDGEEDRRTKFRNVYMEKLVEAFGADLEKMRSTDPALQGARLRLLIEALKSGADIFNDPRYAETGSKNGGVDEVGVIIGDA